MSPPPSAIVSSDNSPTLAKASVSVTCQCLQMTASILEELEAYILSVDPSSIDAMMNFHQEILGSCSSVLLCWSCANRPEAMMLLALISNKLASICEMASTKSAEDFQTFEANSTLSSKSTPNDGNESISRRDQLMLVGRQPGEGFVSTRVQFCGEYRVEHQRDWACLAKLLIRLQLKALGGFLKRVKLVSYIARRETHLLMLNACELRVQKIEETLRKNVSG
jgi:hypothetical protein